MSGTTLCAVLSAIHVPVRRAHVRTNGSLLFPVQSSNPQPAYVVIYGIGNMQLSPACM